MFFLAAVALAVPFNVRDFGSKGDGRVVDSPAIDRAIRAAASSGGTVIVPPGTYLCGTIHLKSHTHLQIAKGATIIAAKPRPHSRYDLPEPNPWGRDQDFGHSHWANALITGADLTDISISGQGTIDGRGLDHIERKKPISPDKAIALVRCQNVSVQGVTIRHGGWFGLLATGVDNLTVDGLTIDTNRDGMDIDCCRHVAVTNCRVNSPNDDAICLKSSFALGEARPTQDVTITNRQVSGFDEGTLLNGKRGKTKAHPTGRIKFGTESDGGFKNITISNCSFEHCCGLNLATVDGGVLEDVSVQNITMRDIGNSPLFIRLGARLRGAETSQPGILRRVSVEGLHVIGSAAPIMICGIPGHPVEDVSLSDVTVASFERGTKAASKKSPPELIKAYPEPGSFGRLPASSVYIRHAHGVHLSNCRFSFAKADARPRIVLQDASGVDTLNVVADPGSPLIAPFVPKTR